MQKLKVQIFLLASCVVMLLATCLMTIFAPVYRDNERAQRETVVKQRLCAIRNAQMLYLKRHHTYAPTFKQLVDEKMLADSLQYIPFTEQQKFHLATTTIVEKSGKNIPLVECSARFDEYLSGMDHDYISSITQQANSYGNYPGLKFGDITSNNDNAANWE